MKRLWFLGPILLLAACTTTGGNTPGFTLSVSPQELTLAQESSGELTVSVTRKNGFAGAVTLELLNPPVGVSGSALTVPEAAANGVMTISVSGAAATQSGSVTMKGTSGSLSSQASFTLTVSEGSAERPPSSFERIEEALEQGLVDYETALSYKVFAAFGDARLPEAYRGDDTRLSGTSIMKELVAEFDGLSPQTQAQLRPFLLTPPEAGSWYELQQGENQELMTAAIQWRTLNAQVANVKVWWDHGNFPQDELEAMKIAAALDSTIWPRLTGLMQKEPLPDCGAGCPNGGGDSRLDIYLVLLPRGADGLTHAFEQAYPTPSYISLKRTIVDQDWLFAALAHEIMHAIQNSYEVTIPTGADWLSEATAKWAEDYVYPAGNYEHAHAGWFLHQPELPLNHKATKADTREYDAYLFFFYLTRQFKRPEIIREIWQKASRPNDLGSALEVLDAVIPGKFVERWPEFARLNYNKPPVDDYQRWDGLSYSARTTEVIVTDAAVRPLSTRVRYLAAMYWHLEIKNDEIRSAVFDNPFADGGSPTAKVQALVKIAGQDWSVEDWTSVERKSFCRDRAEENLQEVVLIISNSEWENSSHELAAGDIELTTEEECFAIDRIEGPGTIIMNGPPGDFDLHWTGSPTFPVTLTVTNVSCALTSCAGGELTFEEEANPLGFTYRCFVTDQGDEPPPTGPIINEVTLTDSTGLTTTPFTHTITCQL